MQAGNVVQLLALSLGVGVISACGGSSAGKAYQPAPELKPEEVVQRQVVALGQNGAWGDDRGIQRAYRFASPDNRQSVGATERFTELLKNPGYRPLLNHREASYGEVVYRDDRAAVPVSIVSISGQRVDYVFFLSRNQSDDCGNCWLTDAVHPGPDHLPDARARVRL